MAAVRGPGGYDVEYRVRRLDGAFRWFKTRGLPIRDGGGKITKWFGTCTDITDRKRTEDQLLQLKEAAEAANRAKDEFLANVSHELRTPISAVLLWTKLLARGSLPPDQHPHALKSIELSAIAQDQLVGDLLDVTRLSSGGIRLDLRDCDPTAVVAAAADVVRPSASEKGVELAADPGPSPGAVRADPARLLQVVTNLLSNAIKFTPTGGRVTVGLDRAGDRVLIRVADTGAGIPPGFLPHIFERFQRGESTASRREGGLGLGLAIVRQLVEAHGGSISAESPGEGLGSTFTVNLPAARPDERPAGGANGVDAGAREGPAASPGPVRGPKGVRNR
jgi:signal transduction histidine kinase